MKNLITADFNPFIKGKLEGLEYCVEIGQSTEKTPQWEDNIIEYEFYETDFQAKDRANEINEMNTTSLDLI